MIFTYFSTTFNFCLVQNLSTMKKSILLVCVILFVKIAALAQTKISNLFTKTNVNSINSTELKTSVNKIASGQLLVVNNVVIDEIYSQKDNYELTIPNKNGDLVILLSPATITSADFKVMTPNGEFKMELPTFYRGTIKGDPKSFVAITVTKNSMEGLIQNEKINLTIGKIKDRKENFHIVYNTNEIKNTTPICAGEVMRSVEGLTGEVERNVSSSTCKTVEIYLEADYQMYLDWGSNTNTVVNQMTSIFNNVAALYLNEGVSIVISTLFVWNSVDPYTSATSTGESLDLLYNYWQGAGNSFNGDIVHLVSTKSLGGGVAYYIFGPSVFNGMTERAVFANCSKQYAKGLSASITNSVQNIPTFSWNVEVIAHELGHNFGLPHTHSCTWSDGVNSTGPIDNCGPTAGYNEGCANGANPGASGGTIMSYCHLVNGVGINFANGFGDLPGAKMFAEVGAANSTCLTGSFVQKPTLKDTIICESSSLTLTATACSGVYKWYSEMYGGSSIFSGSSYVTPVMSSNTNYYVSCTQNDCESHRSKISIIFFSSIVPASASKAVCGTNASTTLSASDCGSLTYNWYNVPSGGTSISTGQSFAVNNINGNQTYYVDCSRQGCGNTQRIAVNITHSLICPYCEPEGLICSAFDNISAFKINKGLVNLLDNGPACTNSGYSLTNPSTPVYLVRDSTYALTIRNPGRYEDGLKIWMDFNQNNVFENSEILYSWFDSNLWTEKVTNVVIPSTAKVGATRLRIKVTYFQLPVEPCSATEGAFGGNYYGEIADYIVNLKCPDNVIYLAISQAPGTYKVSETIESQANVASGTTYQAGKNIQLNPGFQAGGNEVFHAKIAGCQ